MLFQKLVENAKKEWDAYLNHAFVKKLENGSLERAQFIYYLKQDAIYLFNYAKACAQLCINANTTQELYFAFHLQKYTLEGEILLHENMLEMNIDSSSLTALDENIACIAYTRYLLHIGQKGDFLETLCALAPCMTGYAAIGRGMQKNIGAQALENHPYKKWICLYFENNFQKEAAGFEDFINGYTAQVTEAKRERLAEIFITAVKLETAFWQAALEMKPF